MANILTLGEIMLRLSTDIGVRLNETQQLICHYGGGEANVAISLANLVIRFLLQVKCLITH